MSKERHMSNMSLASAKREAGGISSRNSKMPGSSFALPPSKCATGGKLMGIEGSTCHKCYAVKSERMYPSVRQGWLANYMSATRLIAEKPEHWAKAMAFQITHHARKNAEDFHRWFDAGDLQSVDMLAAIVLVCIATPHIKHWLPTREAKIVADWRKAGGVEPSNLVIRISSTMIDDAPRNAPNTSTVHNDGADHSGHECPSDTAAHRAMHPQGKANCGPCRACWDKAVPNVSYPLH
jgi:predicted transposase YbfD/YdcC